MLQRALRQVLAFRYLLQPATAFNERARHTTQPEIDGKCDPNGSAAHDDHLIVFVHASSLARAYINDTRQTSLRVAGRRRSNAV
jgi:hypothetical protein